MPATRPSLTSDQQERIETRSRHDRRGPAARRAEQIDPRKCSNSCAKLCGDPLERRFRYAMHTPETLAIELGCTKLEAFDRLEKLWADLSTYFYAQQAQVDGQGNAVAPRLTMVFPGQIAPQSEPMARRRALAVPERRQCRNAAKSGTSRIAFRRVARRRVARRGHQSNFSGLRSGR
jgi:uncharacterized protein with von Willebrand factor type A (vWA) domain